MWFLDMALGQLNNETLRERKLTNLHLQEDHKTKTINTGAHIRSPLHSWSTTLTKACDGCTQSYQGRSRDD